MWEAASISLYSILLFNAIHIDNIVEDFYIDP